MKRLSYYKLLRLIFSFYKGFLFPGLLVDLISMKSLWRYGMVLFSALFWFKIITSALIFYFIKSHRSREFYYYQNLGLSKTILWITTLGFDFILFLVLMVLTYKIR